MLFLDAAESHIKYFSSSLVAAIIGWSLSSVIGMVELSVVVVLSDVEGSSTIFWPSLVHLVSVLTRPRLSL